VIRPQGPSFFGLYWSLSGIALPWCARAASSGSPWCGSTRFTRCTRNSWAVGWLQHLERAGRRSPHPENPEDPAAGGSILIRDAHPGYISFDEYQRNVARLVANRNMYGGMQNRGTAREGRSLIQGLALCGRCGRHMLVSYLPDGTPSYVCRTSRTLRPCQEINGRHIDPLVEKAVLEALRPR